MNELRIGKVIARLRKKAGLTQSALADMLCVSNKTVSKWESGGGYPEITLLLKLSSVFGVSVDYLLKGDTQGIAIAGNMIVDMINMVDKYPCANMLANINKTERAVGGCVPNTLIDLAKIDSDLYLTAIGKVGDDVNGEFLISEIKKYGIDTSKIVKDSDSVTAYTHVMTDERNGERTFFVAGGANKTFCIDDIDTDSLECRIFHIGYILLLDALDQDDPEYGTKMARLLDMVSKKGIKTSIDVVSEDSDRFKAKIIPCLKYCDYTFMNEIECCKLSGLSPREKDGKLSVENIKATMEMMIECGVKDRVIIHSAEAGFIMDCDKNFFVMPSLEIAPHLIKGSVGAGDAFAAACLYGLYKGYGNERLLEFASASAACNLFAADSISGMKKFSEIEEISKNFKRRTL